MMIQIDRIIASIKDDKYTQRELINLHANAMKYEGISDESREEITAFIEIQLKVKFPAAAKKLFGAKDTEARELLNKIYHNLEKEFDLSKNKLKNGVKTGGSMINGTNYVNVYISYKNTDNKGAYLDLRQLSVEGELTIIVSQYCTGKNKYDKNKEFGIDELQQAELTYRNYLKQIINRNHM